MTTNAATTAIAAIEAQAAPHVDAVMRDFEMFDDPEIEAEPGAEIAPAVRFSIDNTDRANWYLRKLGNIDAERERVAAQYRAICEDLDRQEKSLKGRFQCEFEEFVLAQLRAVNFKTKTLRFLQATVSVRTVAGRVVYDWKAAFAYAEKAAKQLLRPVTVTELDRDAYKALAMDMQAESGELPDGATWVDDKESITVKFGGLQLAESEAR